MNNLIKIISIISIPLVLAFTLSGCDLETLQNNLEKLDSGDDMTINLKEGYKFVDIKIGIYSRSPYSTYIYTLTKKCESSEKPETYKLDMVFNSSIHGSLPKHITVIEK